MKESKQSRAQYRKRRKGRELKQATKLDYAVSVGVMAHKLFK